MVEKPKINYENLTSEGRLQPEDYNRAIEYLRHLNGLCQDTEGDSKSKYQAESFGFLDTLPEEDKSELLMAIMGENLEVKVTGVSVKSEQKED